MSGLVQSSHWTRDRRDADDEQVRLHGSSVPVLWHSWRMQTLADLRAQAVSTVRDYTDAARHFSFRTYDVLPLNQSDSLRAEDVLAANLLSLRLTWREVIPLFAAGDGPPQRLLEALNSALVEMRSAAPFESYASEADLAAAMEPIAAANRATKVVDGWTPVTVSKVLHRHAPRAVPIIDSRVRAFYEVRAGQEGELRERLWRDIRENLAWLTPLAESTSTPDGRALPVLRLADILIWASEPGPV